MVQCRACRLHTTAGGIISGGGGANVAILLNLTTRIETYVRNVGLNNDSTFRMSSFKILKNVDYGRQKTEAKV